jgi:hypothetical protein
MKKKSQVKSADEKKEGEKTGAWLCIVSINVASVLILQL